MLSRDQQTHMAYNHTPEGSHCKSLSTFGNYNISEKAILGLISYIEREGIFLVLVDEFRCFSKPVFFIVELTG